VFKSVLRRLRITEIGFAEEGYQDLVTRGVLEKKPHPSLEGVRNVQRLMLNSNPRVGEIKLEEIVDRNIMRKLDDSGFIDRLYGLYPTKVMRIRLLWQAEMIVSRETYCNRTGIVIVSSQQYHGQAWSHSIGLHLSRKRGLVP
jgi:hypothetical protein